MRAVASMVALLLIGCGEARPTDGDRRCLSTADCERIHPPGIADPASPDFHGGLIQSLGWKLATCQKCHGEDFAGGTSKKSCLGCHEEGPTACTTCHGQPPSTGAHATHVPRFACSECHVVPQAWDEPGHLFAADGSVIARATLTFGPLATHGGATPAFSDGKCANTYCHGGATPAWTGGAGEAACGSCHAIPPSTARHQHPNHHCAQCHPRVAADDGTRVLDAALHVDGKVSLGDDQNTCDSCHPTARLSGAHAQHTQAPHKLAKPIACTECHRVPQMVSDPGHIDAPSAQVFPAGVGLLARSDGAQPRWDAAGATCSGVYCHGNGAHLGADAAATVTRAPTWTSKSAAVCGACHGVPPRDAAHAQSLGLADCARCHPETMDATGALLPDGKHLDGVIDAQ